MKSEINQYLFVLTLTLTLGGTAHGTIIGHTNVDQVASLPQSTMNLIGRQKWFFAHASVGANIMQGMQTLNESDTNRFRFVEQVYGDGSSILAPPASTVPGTIYDAPRGNPGWQEKFVMFDQAVRTQGWHSPLVTAVMNKLCFIDQVANPTNYITLMTALEADFPDTVFVYTTMPLMTSADSDNILRCGYNRAVRTHCLANHRLLFDIADIESHDASGKAVTFTNNSVVYERLYDSYSSDGGHLNSAGEQRVALGWYAVAAALNPAVNVAHLSGNTNAITFSWPAWADGWILEQTNTFSSATAPWTHVSLPCQTNGGVFSVTITNDHAIGAKFFRLRRSL